MDSSARAAADEQVPYKFVPEADSHTLNQSPEAQNNHHLAEADSKSAPQPPSSSAGPAESNLDELEDNDSDGGDTDAASSSGPQEVTGSSRARPPEEELKRISSGKGWKKPSREVRLLLENTSLRLEEKVALLHAHFLHQTAQIRQGEKELLALHHKWEQAERDREMAYGEASKGAMVRQKLESLCRELQRQNKMVMEDSKRMAAEEQQKRQELSTKFHSTIQEITAKLEEQGDERIRQVKENETLRDKLKHLSQQYELREQHFAHQLRTKALERQLLDAKLKLQQDHGKEEEQKNRMYGDQIAQLLKTESELRSQLAMYGDKFEQFQDTLTKSNEVFATFKQEMEKMSKSIKRLEKEKAALKLKCDKSEMSLMEVMDDRNAERKAAEVLRTQKERLEALCRSLQLERKNNAQQQQQQHPSTNHVPPQPHQTTQSGGD